MDTPIMIIGIILVVIMAIPLYFVIRAHKVDNNQIKTLFAQNSQDNKYKFQLIANQGRKVLGMDSHQKGYSLLISTLKNLM